MPIHRIGLVQKLFDILITSLKRSMHSILEINQVGWDLANILKLSNSKNNDVIHSFFVQSLLP